jgi:hypothetical protein
MRWRPWTAISTTWCFRSDTLMGVSSIEPTRPLANSSSDRSRGAWKPELRPYCIRLWPIGTAAITPGSASQLAARIAGGGTRSRVRRLCITSFRSPSTRINYFLSTGGGPGADTMRCATLATMGTSLLLAGCANGWFPSPSPPAAALASSVASPAAECSAKASSPFGSGGDTSSLRVLIEDPARNNPAVQGCPWEKGTRVSYGPSSLTTGALAERK